MQPFYAPDARHRWALETGDRGVIRGLGSVAAVMAAVDEVDASRRRRADDTPWMVVAGCAEPASYLSCGIGVRRDRVPVHFNGDVTENAISVSDSADDRERDEEVELRLAGEYVWNSTAHLVDYADARAALEQFLTTGQRPTTIEWEDL